MDSDLHTKIDAIRRKHGCEAVAVAMHDYESGRHFAHEADRWFHAASTIKVAVLLGLYKLAEAGRVRLDDRLHVRNRFRSVVDGSAYQIEGSRDGDSVVHKRIGRSMKLAELAHAMITRSSNLATNLLLDHLGLEEVQRVVTEAGLDGLKIVRGVEDTVAHDHAMNNEATAEGLVGFFRLVREEGYLSQSKREQMRVVLLAQEFNSMIPAKLPNSVMVAHKTGEISTACHDAGLIYFTDRQPYALAILTQSQPDAEERPRVVAEISALIHAHLTK